MKTKVKQIKSEITMEDVKKAEAILEDAKDNLKERKGIDNPLSGFFVSRMQANS